MGSGLSRSKGGSSTEPKYALPALSPQPRRGVGFFVPDNAHSRQPTCGLTVEASPRTMLRPTTQACSEATTRPNTQYRPGTNATKSARVATGQSDEREVKVMALDFGVERTSPPMSDRSGSDASRTSAKADQYIETVQHFPSPPDGGALMEDEGKSDTTYASASVQDPGSLPLSRGMTPLTASIMSPPPSRPHTGFVDTSHPGTRGIGTSLAAPLESEEMQMMVLQDDDASNVGSPRSGVENLLDGIKEGDSETEGIAAPGEASEMLNEDGESEGVSRATTVRKKGEAPEEEEEEIDFETSVDNIQGSDEVKPTKEETSPQPSPSPKKGAVARRSVRPVASKELEQQQGSQKKLYIFADSEQEEVDEIEQLRRKKAAKLKREADVLEAIRAKVKECAGRVMQPADPDALIFEMHWGFPPRARSPGDELVPPTLRPPTPPPVGWEEVVRANRKFRLAIRVTLGAWIERALRNSLSNLYWAIADKKYFKEREQAVRNQLNRWFRDILIPVYTEWKEVSAQMANMRKKSKKVMMWIMNKDIIRAFGAWVACWAHKKDWRVCALKNCLHTRIKRASREEILMFAKAKRGVALLREFASLTVHHLNEWIASSKVDIESIHHNLTLEELMRQEVFKIDEKDKAMQLVWKIDRLMREDTTRLDHLAIWDGKMLLQVDIFMDDLEALQAEKDKENGVNDPASEIRVLNVDLSPVGITKQSAQMNISSERMVDTWAWGYILDISQGKQNAPAKLQAVKAKLVVQEYGIAMVHVVDVINQTEKFVSELKPGLGPDEQWYDFEFGEYDEEGNYQQVLVEWEDGFAVVVSISDRGSKDDSQTPCRFVYFLDHRPTRAINPQVKVRPGSFNGKWHFTPASRSAELQVLLRVDASFGRDAEKEEQEQPTPTSYQKGVEKVQAAHRRVEDLLRKKRKKEKYDPKQLEEARIELRRLALGSCDEMFEDRLGNIPSMKLLIDAPTHSTCAYHPKMREFWMLDPNIQLNFIICGLDGRLKRDVTLMSIDNLKIFSFCFDDEGDMFIANNQHTFYRYIPADGELCATYLRMWKVDLFDPVYPHNSWHNASGITADYNSIYGIFKLGPILQMSKAAGSVMRIIRLQFEVSNIEQMIFIMHRFIIVDAHMIKVCSLYGELVWVPLGAQGNMNNGTEAEANPNATNMTCNTDGLGGKVINWRTYIENGMDRPRILWDGSFLWISETHLRKLDDNQLKVRHFMWHCYAPMTWAAHLPVEPEATRQYGKRHYVDLGIKWDIQGILHSEARDAKADHTPGTITGSGVLNSNLPTPVSQRDFSVSRQASGLNTSIASNSGHGGHDSTHFKRLVSPVVEQGEQEEDGDEHILKPFQASVEAA